MFLSTLPYTVPFRPCTVHRLIQIRVPADTPSLPASSSNFPAPSCTHNGQPPAILLSGQNFETPGSSSGLPEAGSSQCGLESPTNLPSSRVTGIMEVPSSGMNHFFPFHQENLQFGYDCDIATGGRPIMSSMSGDLDNRRDEFIAELGLTVADLSRHPDNSSPDVQPVADVTRVDGLTALDRRSFPVDAHAIQSAPGMIPFTESHRSERRVSCSPPPSTWNSPEIHTSQVDTCPLSGHVDPQSSALAHPNLIPHPCQPVTISEPTDSTTSCTTSLCHGSQDLHHPPFPRPPPEVSTLLMAESSGDVLSPVFARNSHLVPWELPSEIGHFWSGFFKISEIKVTRTCHTVRAFDLTFVARKKRVHYEALRIHLQSGVPGVFIWNGCLEARIYSWMMSNMTIVNGLSGSCDHGGIQRKFCRSIIFLWNVLAYCSRSLFSPPSQRTLLQLGTFR